MKPGDRDTPGTRLYAEREFREQAQVLVATEAAGEGINLQFCWFMINFQEVVRLKALPQSENLLGALRAALDRRGSSGAAGTRCGRTGDARRR